MPRRILFQENHYYHIYNRWLNKQTLFHTTKDFERFLYYMIEQKEAYKESLWIVAYCILPNHFHFVIINKKEWFFISDFIRKISSSYWKYLWAKYNIQWKNPIFEWRFKSKILDNEEYLNQCIEYVEFNPIKHWLVDTIEDRLFTSYDKSKKLKPNLELLNIDWEF